ncbi:hypothetical protein ACRYJU_09230 [Alloalcanivorax xenomutans]|uniref:antitoxin PaaA2 family protein n=1 Tax=Alloalcanivorax xenomutans TaxID=1094342 RepID=UPI003BA9685A
MATQTSMLHVRVDEKLKADATETLSIRCCAHPADPDHEGRGLPAGLTMDPAAHDTWFREKVLEMLADTRPGVPHDQAMADVQALIDRKRGA